MITTRLEQIEKRSKEIEEMMQSPEIMKDMKNMLHFHVNFLHTIEFLNVIKNGKI